MAAALREILAEYGFALDTSQIESADSIVDGLGDKLASFGKWVAAAFAVGKVVDFSKQLINTADHINDTAQRLGVGTDELQAWQYAAKLSGIEADEFASSLQRLGSGIAEAASGAGNAKTFRKLGVDLKNADGSLKSSIQVFEEAGLAIGQLQNPTEAAGLAADLFGKQYARLLPLFREGPQGIAKLKKEFQDLGGGLSSDFIEHAAEFNDDLDKLSVIGTSLGGQVLGPLLPLITKLAEGIASFGRALAGTSKETDALSVYGRAYGGIVRIVAQAVSGVGKFSNGMKFASRIARVLVEPLLDIEDFLVFLAGGDSVLGDWVDENFGKGSAEKVRGFFGGLVKGIDNTVFKVEWLAGKIAEFGVGAVLAAGDVESAFLRIPASLQAAFDAMWNAVIDDAAAAVTKLGGAVKKLPGFADTGNSLEAAGSVLGNAPKRTGGLGELAQLQADDVKRHAAGGFLLGGIKAALEPKAPADLAAAAAAAQANANALATFVQATVAARQAHAMGAPGNAAQATASAPPQWIVDVQAPTKIEVNVPPGADADLTKRVGDATKKASTQANNDLAATLAASTTG
ncbi:MAG TPA: hypothetical protein VHB79_38825 [Polyangiaceae bacterium]|nr:hypothetical protein [Polyangiaceae bacterium]